MSRLSPTRASLLEKRNEIATARRGVEILRSKRDALTGELFQAASKALEFRTRASALAASATEALASAEGAEGEASLASLAWVTEREVTVQIDVRNVWGVRIPSIIATPLVRRSPDRGYGLLSLGASVDDAAEAYERLLSFVLENAHQEIRLRRLAAELRRTSRKVNTLEHDVLPRLGRITKRIEMALDEQEREDRFRSGMLRGEGP